MHADPDSESGLWPLVEITVDGLFGDRDFSLTLLPDLTVLTGENGSGKSTLLKAIHLIAQEHWLELYRLPLGSLHLDFEGGEVLEVRWEEEELTISGHGGEWNFDAESADQVGPAVLYELRQRGRDNPRVRAQRQAGMWRSDVMYANERVEHLVAPEWLNGLTERFQTKWISARRLEHKMRPDPNAGGEGTPVPVVDQFAADLRELMRNQLSVYAADSRRQEKSLPGQIVQAMEQGPAESAEALADEVEELRAVVRELAESLARVGLFQEEDPDQFADYEYPREKPEILLAVREVYRVTRQRLEQLTDLRTDLQLFSSFLNERFSNKQIYLDQQVGIAVELASGELIRPSQLSSGEQQLLALAYELLFGSEPETVVLLDEPELSLHVAWLQGLLATFLDIGDGRRLQFLVATHSPSVLRGQPDRERSLDLSSA
jgi:ABC-type lipoprotein export system ATPase subunit